MALVAGARTEDTGFYSSLAFFRGLIYPFCLSWKMLLIALNLSAVCSSLFME